jgi:thiol-disulfide isomerase/thioredoxin
MSPPIEETLTRENFYEILRNNPGKVIFKFGAEWCSPCNRIKKFVNACCETTSDTVLCYIVDVDDSFELYAHLKSRKLINGIPALFRYDSNNTTIGPDDIVVGTEQADILAFFKRADPYSFR